MKKSVEILGLPIISITEGRELGISKSLLIDANNGVVAAITIEDDEWYRGVKLIPYESVIAIGEDAVTITHSENILKLDEAGDYERFLIENIRVIGTKAITKKGRIQGTISEVFIGEGGKIEQCEITAPDGSTTTVDAAHISKFGKQVTVVDVDGEKKNSSVTETPAFEVFHEEPAQDVWTPAVEEQPVVETVDEPVIPETPVELPDEPVIPETPVEISDEPVIPETPVELPDEPVIPETPVETVDEPVIPETPVELPDEPVIPETPVENVDEPVIPDIPVENADEPVIPETPVELPDEPVIPETPVELSDEPVIPETPVELPTEPVIPETPVEPVVESTPEPAPAPATTDEPAKSSEMDQKIEVMTKQAKDLKAALRKARDNKQAAAAASMPLASQKEQVETKVIERRRRALVGKHATKTITADSGTTVVEAGAEITEEILQRARLSNKFIELSMNVQ